MDDQPGRLRRGGPPTGAGRPLPTWNVCPRVSVRAGACGSRWNCSICSLHQDEQEDGSPLGSCWTEGAESLAEIRRYMEEHLDEPSHHSGLEPPGLSLRHYIQGGIPPPVRSAGPHLAAPAADGTGGGVAAHALSVLGVAQSGGIAVSVNFSLLSGSNMG